MNISARLTSCRGDSFHAARRPGRATQRFATVDADGVALAAIQGLNEKLEGRSERAEVRTRELEHRLEQKETEIAELKQRLDALERVIRSQRREQP
jgi:uncharacterized protein YceH (UPF0502 family)